MLDENGGIPDSAYLSAMQLEVHQPASTVCLTWQQFYYGKKHLLNDQNLFFSTFFLLKRLIRIIQCMYVEGFSKDSILSVPLLQKSV